MNHTKIQLTILLLLATTSLSLYAQSPVSNNMGVAGKVTAPPTASSLAYPQSLFVDSQNGHIWIADFDNNRVLRFDVSSLTNVAGTTIALTDEQYKLGQNYPNPFNPSTTITFAVKNTEHATVTIYNLLGQEVATLFNGVAAANELCSLSFDAKNLPSGMYFYALRSANKIEVKKMSVLK
jgi:Secretion system C-terminal sorting domain/NHL repeat